MIMNYIILMPKNADINDFYIDEDNFDAHAELYDLEEEDKCFYINQWCFGCDHFDDVGEEEISNITPDDVYIVAYDPGNFYSADFYQDNWEEWENIVNIILKDDYKVYYGHN